MAKLLHEKQNVFFHEYAALKVAGPGAGVGLTALPPVRNAVGNGHDSKTITLSCGKLTTGVTVPQWSAILMLRKPQLTGDVLPGRLSGAIWTARQTPRVLARAMTLESGNGREVERE